MNRLITTLKEEEKQFRFMKNEMDMASWNDMKNNLIDSFIAHLSSRKMDKDFNFDSWKDIYKKCMNIYFDNIASAKGGELYHQNYETLSRHDKTKWLREVIEHMKIDFSTFPNWKTNKYWELWDEWRSIQSEYNIEAIDELDELFKNHKEFRLNQIECSIPILIDELRFENHLNNTIDEFYDFISGYGSDKEDI